jgi:hypothetical protein
MIGERQLLGAMIAGLMLAACAPKPMPAANNALRAAVARQTDLSILCLTALRPGSTAPADPRLLLDHMTGCEWHLDRAWAILAVRCPSLPATAPQSEQPASGQRPEAPVPDELLVHLCAVFPWQDRSALARL